MAPLIVLPPYRPEARTPAQSQQDFFFGASQLLQPPQLPVPPADFGQKRRARKATAASTITPTRISCHIALTSCSQVVKAVATVKVSQAARYARPNR